MAGFVDAARLDQIPPGTKGSVAEEVVRSAPCAVLTLTPTAQQKAAHLKMERREDVAS